MAQHHYLGIATLAVIMIVGMVTILEGQISGLSFAQNTFTARPVEYSWQNYRGFGYGPYQDPMDTSIFIAIHDYCLGTDTQFGKKQECCNRQCFDTCDGHFYTRPGVCVNQCKRACNP